MCPDPVCVDKVSAVNCMDSSGGPHRPSEVLDRAPMAPMYLMSVGHGLPQIARSRVITITSPTSAYRHDCARVSAVGEH